ncbi:HAMP domain-containing sensor histidine kinase [Sphingomonas sp. 1P06PA]|uniref:sensor histidine kinase n=1 Tax=Sphingomonas sp. 1P06PA TaxID=554121 RepID=UPI0039A6E720
MIAPQPPIRGHADRAGRLVDADPPLAGLQARAGGVPGGPIAVPQLAALVRLVLRLKIVVSRGVVAADGDQDLDLWVRAAPDGDGVSLAIVGWTERPASLPVAAASIAREHDHLRAEADWLWECDAALAITGLSANAAASVPHDAIGAPLTRIFALRADRDGAMPLIDAMAERRRFHGQYASLQADPARSLLLSGLPLTAGDGGFAGFRGQARTLPPEPAEPGGSAFRDRLGSALRQPLDRIIASAEAIREQDGGPLRRDYAGYAGDIASAGRHLLALVGDLVDLSDIESADFRPERDPIDLADVARRAAGLLAIRAAERAVRIDRPAEADTAPATGDFRRALQIAVNLIGNAIRHSPQGGTIHLACNVEPGLARLTVADQGAGIAAEDQARIFEKFARLDPATPDGSGLGLYIARRLARAMGGDVEVDSIPGQGARFTLTLRDG